MKFNQLPETPDGYYWDYHHEANTTFDLWFNPTDDLDQDDLSLGWFIERSGKVHWYWNFRHEVYDNWKDALLTTVTRHKMGGLQDQGRKVF